MLETRTRGGVKHAADVYAEIVRPGTPEHAQALRFQQERFALVSRRDTASETTFVETTDYAPDGTVPIVVRQYGGSGKSDALLATARVELPGATVIETMIRLRPGSAGDVAMRRRQVAEIGGFATPTDLDRATLVEVIDVIVEQVIHVAEAHGIEWLWFFPRKGFISVMRAAVPGLLPPYRLSYRADWLGWNEGSPQLDQFRALRLRGVPAQPQIFQIARADFAADLAARQALRAQRAEQAEALERLLVPAMWQAQREINAEIARAHGEAHHADIQHTAENPDFPHPARGRSEK